MLKNSYPVRWADSQAVVTLPEHIGASNAGQVRDELLSVINLGAVTLIADMTATISCDHAGADAVVRAWQRTVSSGTELRLVVTDKSVSRVLGLRGLDRQVSVYPSLEAAAAARLPAPAAVVPAAGRSRGTDQPPDGAAAALASPGGLPGLPAQARAPDGLREAHRGQRATWARAMGAHPAGRGKDGATVPVLVSLTPVTAGPGQLVRDVAGTGRLGGLASPARDAAAAAQEHLQLLDTVITGLFHAGISLQAAASLPAGVARQRTEAVLGELDDIIRQIRSAVFADCGQPGP